MEKKSKAIAQVLKATTKRQAFGKDFQYVVQRLGKSKICFGSAQERPDCKVVTRLGAEFSPKSLASLAPGMYLTPTPVSALRPTSIRGTVLGGRTAAREQPPRDNICPSPCTYTLSQPSAPIGPVFVGGRRFKSAPGRTNVGPGYYSVTVERKQIAFAHSLGSRKSLIPAIQMKCGPVNPDICEKCKKPPVGDYWYFTPEITRYEDKTELSSDPQTFHICRPCHEKERIKPEMFVKSQIKKFKKVRDCSQVHFHDGCEARLLLLPPRDIAKIREKEAYLALYFL